MASSGGKEEAALAGRMREIKEQIRELEAEYAVCYSRLTGVKRARACPDNVGPAHTARRKTSLSPSNSLPPHLGTPPTRSSSPPAPLTVPNSPSSVPSPSPARCIPIPSSDDEVVVLDSESDDPYSDSAPKAGDLDLMGSGTASFAKRFPWDRDLTAVLRRVFGLTEFRSQQRSIINAVLSGRNVIAIMPTGFGKSLCYQVPALLDRQRGHWRFMNGNEQHEHTPIGLTIVISPLLSLMHDQVTQLQSLGVRAALFSSDVPAGRKKAILADRSIRLLYVTPETFVKSSRLNTYMRDTRQLHRLVVDEAHCCSEWGHDFRREYRQMHRVMSRFPGVPILAVTATASSEVASDTQQCLRPNGRWLEWRTSVNRPNLFWEVLRPRNLKQDILSFITARKLERECGLVYVFSRAQAEEVAMYLMDTGKIRAGYYHAGVPKSKRSMIHEAWRSGSLKCVVATTAFGMGIDKENVRYCIHHSLSKGVEAYYQEAGRAGRDRKLSYCALFFNPSDVAKQSARIASQGRRQSLYRLCEYAMASVGCRRTMIGSFFGEESTPCRWMCDLCVRRAQQPTGYAACEDITGVCKLVLKVVQSCQSSSVTVRQVVDTLDVKAVVAKRTKAMRGAPKGVLMRDSLRSTRSAQHCLSSSLWRHAVPLLAELPITFGQFPKLKREFLVVVLWLLCNEFLTENVVRRRIPRRRGMSSHAYLAVRKSLKVSALLNGEMKVVLPYLAAKTVPVEFPPLTGWSDTRNPASKWTAVKR